MKNRYFFLLTSCLLITGSVAYLVDNPINHWVSYLLIPSILLMLVNVLHYAIDFVKPLEVIIDEDKVVVKKVAHVSVYDINTLQMKWLKKPVRGLRIKDKYQFTNFMGLGYSDKTLEELYMFIYNAKNARVISDLYARNSSDLISESL